MGLLTLGLGPGRGGLLTLGLGQRIQQTAHPQWFNTPLPGGQNADEPDRPVPTAGNYDRNRIGTDGDPEYALWVADPDCVYNGRAVEVFVPEDVELPPGSIDRIRARLEMLRPKTCTVRVVSTRGAERVLLPSTGEPQ